MVLFLVEQVRQAEQVRLEARVEKENSGFRKLEKRIVEELKRFEKKLERFWKKADKSMLREVEKSKAHVHNFKSTNYDFGLESAYFEKGSTTETKKAYYKLGAESRENATKAGNSYESYASRQESVLLKQGQTLQQEAKACHQQGKAYIVLDLKEKEARDSIKLFSPATWQFMYAVNGKIEFN